MQVFCQLCNKGNENLLFSQFQSHRLSNCVFLMVKGYFGYMRFLPLNSHPM